MVEFNLPPLPHLAEENETARATNGERSTQVIALVTVSLPFVAVLLTALLKVTGTRFLPFVITANALLYIALTLVPIVLLRAAPYRTKSAQIAAAIALVALLTAFCTPLLCWYVNQIIR